MSIQSAFEAVSSYLPDDLNGLFSSAAAVPSAIDFGQAMKFLLLFVGCSLLLTVLGRMILGKRSSLNHSVSSAMGILFLYALSMILYTFQPWELMEQLTPLPFMVFAGDYMLVISFQNSAISVLCHEVLSLVILAFLLNLLDTLIPRGKSIVTWYLLRFITISLAMVLHVLVDWAFDTYLPEVLVTYAPVILLALLAGTMLLGVLNVILGVALAVVDPILGAIYTFFFSNIVGKQLTKAVMTSIIICIVIFLLGHFGYTMICLTESALLTYIPLGLAMLILWYVIGHIL